MVDERMLTIPLRVVKSVPRPKRAPRAIKEIRQFVSRHMKMPEEKVWIYPDVNQKIWERGIEKPPSKIRVRATHNEDLDLIEVNLEDEK